MEVSWWRKASPRVCSCWGETGNSAENLACQLCSEQLLDTMGTPGALSFPANSRDFLLHWKNLWDFWYSPLPSQPVQCTGKALWYFLGGLKWCSKCSSGFNLSMSHLLECFSSHPRGAIGIPWALGESWAPTCTPKQLVQVETNTETRRQQCTALQLPPALCLGSELLSLSLKGYSSFMERKEVSYKAICFSGL